MEEPNDGVENIAAEPLDGTQPSLEGDQVIVKVPVSVDVDIAGPLGSNLHDKGFSRMVGVGKAS